MTTASASATVGAVEHSHSVVLVTVAPSGRLLDRRTVVLTPAELPTHPHHHEGSWAMGRYLNTPGARAITLDDAVALVAQVRAAAELGAAAGLDALAAAVPVPIAALAIRACPPLPATVEARIADNRVQTIADSVMYREALAAAAIARGWTVQWYDRERVGRDAAALGTSDLHAVVAAMGRAAGAPWTARHKLAATAALVASSSGITALSGQPKR